MLLPSVFCLRCHLTLILQTADDLHSSQRLTVTKHRVQAIYQLTSLSDFHTHFGPIKFGIIPLIHIAHLLFYLYRIGTSFKSNGLTMT